LVIASGITYLFGELRWAWYLWHLGIQNPAELSEDYGGAFFQLMWMAIAFLLSFPAASILIWRWSYRHFPAASNQ
jgi:hypothetical protein